MVFIHVDVDVLEDLPDGSDVRGVVSACLIVRERDESDQCSPQPTFKFFRDGKLLDSFSGANKDKLKELLAKFR